MFGFGKQKRLNAKLGAAAATGNVRDIKILLDEGADIDCHGASRWDDTPLGIAAYNGHLPAVRLLLDRGADIEAQDKNGHTPLMSAVLGDRDLVAVELLKRGAKTQAQNHMGLTAADLAEKKNEKVRAVFGSRAEAQRSSPALPAAATDPDEIVLTRQVGDKILEEAFNFAARERISFLRAIPGGPVEAMTRENFDAISERVLRRAFEAYTRQGGSIPEAEVFPAAITKPKLQPGAS
jgi:uncharacterized protein